MKTKHVQCPFCNEVNCEGNSWSIVCTRCKEDFAITDGLPLNADLQKVVLIVEKYFSDGPTSVIIDTATGMQAVINQFELLITQYSESSAAYLHFARFYIKANLDVLQNFKDRDWLINWYKQMMNNAALYASANELTYIQKERQNTIRRIKSRLSKMDAQYDQYLTLVNDYIEKFFLKDALPITYKDKTGYNAIRELFIDMENVSPNDYRTLLCFSRFILKILKDKTLFTNLNDHIVPERDGLIKDYRKFINAAINLSPDSKKKEFEEELKDALIAIKENEQIPKVAAVVENNKPVNKNESGHNSSVASDIPKEGAKQEGAKGNLWLGCGLLLVIAAIIIFAAHSLINWIFKPKVENASSTDPNITQSEPSEANDTHTLQYSIISEGEEEGEEEGAYYIKNIFEDPTIKKTYRYEQTITSDLPENPSKDDLLALAKIAINNILKKEEPTAITLLIYDVKHYPSNYPVAKAIWIPECDIFIEITKSSSSSAKPQSSATAPNNSSTSSSSSAKPQSSAAVPNNSSTSSSSYYSIVDAVFEDLTYDIPGSNSECVRVQYRVWIETEGNASRNAVQALARDLVAQVTSRFDINALSIFVYDGPDMYGEYTVASVDWAPYGDWGRADEVSTGDYSKHSYTIRMR